MVENGILTAEGLENLTTEADGKRIGVAGLLLDLEVTHTLEISDEHSGISERISLGNTGTDPITVVEYAFGMVRPIADVVGSVFPDLANDRIAAIPFRHRPTDKKGFDMDFSLTDIIRVPGRQPRAGDRPLDYPRHGTVAAPHWLSEGWAWIRESESIGIFAFSQERMFFSPVAPEIDQAGVAVRYGGAVMTRQDVQSPLVIGPGETMELGETRYEIVPGGLNQTYYAFRRFLDERGCRFPNSYDPPVHWNELYDNPEWSLASPGHPPEPRMTRPTAYTRELIEVEAGKARDYGCEALYLDPGWDTDFATFIWGEEWLGPCKNFIRRIRDAYGLEVSLHCPLATWMSLDGRGVPSWPRESFQTDKQGNIVEGAVCLGSDQYLDLAEERLLSLCEDGVTFLMFDGNWWNGGCWNPHHGHPVPLAMEDQVRASVELARRIHSRFPNVLIEMHDMVAGGTLQRFTPVYYKYGLPGSYDENWGFELMWRPMDDITSGRARALYYYNLGCNVPVYLHIDLRDDNLSSLLLWWYASTCRHLGIGGTHPVPAVAEAHKQAMKVYTKLSRFYKRGDFYGIHEEAHIHALPEENSIVINLFNLSDESCEVGGGILWEEMGLERDIWYDTPKGGNFDRETGEFTIHRYLPPWSTEVAVVSPVGVPSPLA